MAKLSPDAKRIRAIIISTPFLVASSYLLYKRLILGEEQRTMPKPFVPSRPREEFPTPDGK